MLLQLSKRRKERAAFSQISQEKYQKITVMYLFMDLYSLLWAFHVHKFEWPLKAN